jgi:hypothetical protein
MMDISMNYLIQQAIEMRGRFVSRQVWDETPVAGRYDIIRDVLQINYIDSVVDLWMRSYEMAFDRKYGTTGGGWYYTYDQMICIFDAAMRLAKLQVFQ